MFTNTPSWPKKNILVKISENLNSIPPFCFFSCYNLFQKEVKMQATSTNLAKKHFCINKKPLMNQVSTQY